MTAFLWWNKNENITRALSPHFCSNTCVLSLKVCWEGMGESKILTSNSWAPSSLCEWWWSLRIRWLWYWKPTVSKEEITSLWGGQGTERLGGKRGDPRRAWQWHHADKSLEDKRQCSLAASYRQSLVLSIAYANSSNSLFRGQRCFYQFFILKLKKDDLLHFSLKFKSITPMQPTLIW